jgi:asparagine synthase (glutamine-hydrolysing)
VAAFTIAFDQAAYDETAQAQRTADHLGVELHVISAHDAVLADNFAQAAWHGEMVQYNAHGSARFLLSKAIHDAGYRTVMAGEGADELFAGYGFLQSALGGGDNGNRETAVWLRRALRLFSPLNETQRQIAGTSPLLARASHLLALPPRLVGQFAQAMELLRSILQLDFLTQFADYDPYRHFIAHLDWRGQILGRERAKQLIYIWLRSIFAGYHMAADRLDMAHSVEVRLPFLDHHLFEYASQIPIDRLAPNGQRKHLLRQAVRPFITEETYRGIKKPFYAPPSALRQNSRMHQLTQDTLRSATMAASPFFDQSRLIALLDQYATAPDGMPALLDPLLMMILSLCFIEEKFELPQ